MGKLTTEELFQDLSTYHQAVAVLSKSTLVDQEGKFDVLKVEYRGLMSNIRVNKRNLKAIDKNLRLSNRTRKKIISRTEKTDFELAFNFSSDELSDEVEQIEYELRNIDLVIASIKKDRTTAQITLDVLNQEKDDLILRMGLCRRLMRDCKENMTTARRRSRN